MIARPARPGSSAGASRSARAAGPALDGRLARTRGPPLRATLARRFAEAVGEPPLTYLARWRMHLAAQRLKYSTDTVGAIAREVGYAFNRAFARYRASPRAATGGSRESPDRQKDRPSFVPVNGFQAPTLIPPSLCGSAMMSIATIRPPATVKPTTEIGRAPGMTTRPAVPLTSAGRANRANVEARSSS